MSELTLILLAIAVSLDCLAVGTVYGIRRILISQTILAIIAATTALFTFMGMSLSAFLLRFLPEETGKYLGAAVLFLMGLWLIYDALREKIETNGHTTPLKILRQPLKADRDDSGHIDFKESFLLALALGLDALSIGLIASLVLTPTLALPALTGIFSYVLLFLGLRFGYQLANRVTTIAWSFLPGLLLCLIAILKLF